MPQYSEDAARQVFNRDMSEVLHYYRNLAAQQRPVVEQAIASLTGCAPVSASSAPAAQDDENQVDDEADPAPSEP